ncbi:hypothetical protein Vadar_015323 [Vaccinium darrowii]|uniref:Uncharacterized protein n=1 Tax=Vaccinium darrowii TaxID=229202 RepID=A0ACB7XZ95_9ERIC|nr:hypothetical protein Vadar_015323 [Vaccinium darrowii]
MAIVLFSFITILMATLLHLSTARFELDVDSQKVCGRSHAKDGLEYTKIFMNVTKTMHEEMRKKRFAMRKGGEYPNQIYVLSQCTNDISGEDCDHCFSQASSILVDCLPFTSGRIFLKQCILRFDNYTFFHETTSKSFDQQTCSNITLGGASKHKHYTDAATTLINELVEKAPKKRGYAEGKSEPGDGSSVYGEVGCLKTLDANRCATCLANASVTALNCIPSEEGMALNAGCFVRFFLQPPSDRDMLFKVADYAIGIAFCLAVVFLTGILLGKLIYKRKQNHEQKMEALERNTLVTISMRFKYSTLQKATDDFSESHKIGQGGYGEVYKFSGQWCTGAYLAVWLVVGCLVNYRPGVSKCQQELALEHPFAAVRDSFLTPGYMAPEYLAQGRLTEKVDIYSYGVLVLEIVGGVQNNKYHSEDILSTLVTTTWKHFQQKKAGEIIDTSIAIEDVNEVLRIIQIGLLCTQASPLLRPDVGDVVKWLEHKDLELPNPSKPPFSDEFLTLPDSPLVSSSLRPHEHSISIDSCKYYDVDNNER